DARAPRRRPERHPGPAVVVHVGADPDHDPARHRPGRRAGAGRLARAAGRGGGGGRGRGIVVGGVEITGFDPLDVRFPTSRELDGSDAMNPDPDYSAAYVILRTSDPGLAGPGFVST